MIEALTQKPQGEGLTGIESSRAIAEVQAAVVLARKFPRDEVGAKAKILASCAARETAEAGTYLYYRAGTPIEGPSIRLAEVMARAWGNMQFGMREVDQAEGISEIETYAWDLEANVRQSRIFHVRHERKAHGKTAALDDPRDIYEHISNYGARRMRACILGIIPSDIQAAAVEACKQTLKKKDTKTPLSDRIARMEETFALRYGVSRASLERYLNHPIEKCDDEDLLHLRQLVQGFNEGVSKPGDYFEDVRGEAKQKESASREEELVKEFSTEIPPEETESALGVDEGRKGSGFQPGGGEQEPDRASGGKPKRGRPKKAQSPATPPPPPAAQAGPSVKGGGVPSLDESLGRIDEISNEKGIDEFALLNILKKKYGLGSVLELTPEQAEDLVLYLEGLV